MIPKIHTLLFLLSISLTLSGCGQSKTGTKPTSEEQDYVFFLHNKFIEENDLETEHQEYGRAEYKEILSSFQK